MASPLPPAPESSAEKRPDSGGGRERPGKLAECLLWTHPRIPSPPGPGPTDTALPVWTGSGVSSPGGTGPLGEGPLLPSSQEPSSPTWPPGPSPQPQPLPAAQPQRSGPGGAQEVQAGHPCPPGRPYLTSQPCAGSRRAWKEKGHTRGPPGCGERWQGEQGTEEAGTRRGLVARVKSTSERQGVLSPRGPCQGGRTQSGQWRSSWDLLSP